MRKFKLFTLSLLVIAGASCKKETLTVTRTTSPSAHVRTTPMYFPPTTSATWETVTPASLGWDTAAIEPLLEYLDSVHTKSFMILVNGKIVMENYFNGHDASDSWEWNSAGKTLVSSTVGIAQQEGLLNIQNKVSQLHKGPSNRLCCGSHVIKATL